MFRVVLRFSFGFLIVPHFVGGEDCDNDAHSIMHYTPCLSYVSAPMAFNGKFLVTGGNRTMVAATTIVITAAAKKVQQNVFALYHAYNPHNPPGMHLDFRLSFQDCHLASPALFDSYTIY